MSDIIAEGVIVPQNLVWLFFIIIPFILIVGSVILFYLWLGKVPPSAKLLIRFAFGLERGNAVQIIVSDDKTVRLKSSIPLQGGVFQVKGMEKYMKRKWFLFQPRVVDLLQRSMVPLPFSDDSLFPMPSSVKEGDNTASWQTQLIATQVYTMEGINRPLYMSYLGKSVSVNPAAVAAIGISKNYPRKDDVPTSYNTILGIPLDPTLIRWSFSQMITPAQVVTVADHARSTGRQEAEQASGGRNMMWPIIIIGVLVIAIALIWMIFGKR